MGAQEQTKIILNLITLRALKPAAAGLKKTRSLEYINSGVTGFDRQPGRSENIQSFVKYSEVVFLDLS